MEKTISFVRTYFAFFVIGITFLLSVTSVILYRAHEEPPGTINLRMGHWQLEPGVREGLHQASIEYSRLHPNVRIIQDSIPDSTYGQWVTTGTWDVASIREQVQDQFEIGVLDFPMPLKNDPVYGPFLEGPVYEDRTSGWGLPFGITRQSKHPEIAIDFLLFLASDNKIRN